MYSKIENIEQAENFLINLKRSDNWVSDDFLIQRLEVSLELAKHHYREDLFPYAGLNLCLYYLDNGEYNKAWEFAGMARQYAEKQKNFEKLLNAISLQYRIQRSLGNLEAAQQLINEQMEIAYQQNDIHQIASSYHNQGALFHRQHLKTEAIVAYQKSIDFIIKSGNTYYIAYYYLGFGAILLDFGELNKAEKILKKGFDLAKKNKFILPQALAYSNFGLLYQLQKKENECIKAFKQCILLFHRLKNINDEVVAKIMLAEAYERFDNIPAAEKLLKETIEFSEKNNLLYNLIGIYETLANLYEKQGRYKESLESLRKLVKIKEEYLNAESDKRIHNMEMQQKVDILQLEKQNAEQMANIKHDFLANMSHEIRTPINSILGICYLLEQKALDPVQSDYVHRLKRSGENLLGIVNDVLDISKIESGKMELLLQPFILSDLLQDIYLTLEPRAKEKGIKLQLVIKGQTELNLLGDKLRLYQILLNLVSNAIKFTMEGSVILISRVKIKDKENTEIEFEVRDTGIGIPKDKLDRIFERYEQASAEIKNTFGGTGLGLSISKKMIELMQGNMRVKSRLHQGTRFIATIPFALSKTKQEASGSIDLNPILLDGKSILIADDNTENRLVAKEILLNFNPSIHIFEAENGQQALNLLKQVVPDIIFMDLDMPIMNGIETTQAIKSRKRYKHLPIIGNTASLLSISVDELRQIGFTDLLQKPYQANELLQIITASISR